MRKELNKVKLGLFLAMAGLFFGIGMGIAFGLFEDSFKEHIAQGIAAAPGLHDAKSQSKIWRFAQRAHFHGAAIASFAMVLIMFVMASDLKSWLKRLTSVLIGLSSAYPLAWYSMFWLAPSLGRSAAHGHILTESLTYVGVGSLVLGLLILSSNLFLGLFASAAVEQSTAIRGTPPNQKISVQSIS